jgi:creatinine amidohydrolase
MENSVSGKVQRWVDLKTTDFGGNSGSCIALLPVAAVEQHGPHLPLGTDSYILEAVLARLGKSPPGKAEVLVLPLQSIGDSTEHGDFPGTLSQEAETLIASWVSISEAVAETGIRKLAIVNSHGGQLQIVDIVAQRLRAEFHMLVGRINTFLLGVPEGLFSSDELAFGYHGGEVETSMMLAIAPELVDMSAAEKFSSTDAQLAKDNKSLRAEGGAAFAWQAQDLNAAGVTGNAVSADAKRGTVMLDHIAAKLGSVLDDLAAFNLSDLREGPQ